MVINQEDMVIVPAARSSFMNEHKFVLALSYTTQIIGDNDTTFSLLGIRKIGRTTVSLSVVIHLTEVEEMVMT